MLQGWNLRRFLILVKPLQESLSSRSWRYTAWNSYLPLNLICCIGCIFIHKCACWCAIFKVFTIWRLDWSCRQVFSRSLVIYYLLKENWSGTLSFVFVKLLCFLKLGKSISIWVEFCVLNKDIYILWFFILGISISIFSSVEVLLISTSFLQL